MEQVARLRKVFERLMEVIVLVLMMSLAALIIAAVFYRRAGASLSWYDEVASVMLAWLTYYGAALAATKRAHIGFEGLVEAVPRRWGLTMLIVAEAVVIGFFGVLAWTGWEVLVVLEGSTLVSLPQVSVQLTQSVIPIAAVLFIIGQLLSLPEHWRRVKAGEPLNPEVQVEKPPGREAAARDDAHDGVRGDAAR